MSRKKITSLMIVLLVTLAGLVAVLTRETTPFASENVEIPTTSPQESKGSLFVVPENPIGTIGLTSAAIAALCIFVFKQKKP